MTPVFSTYMFIPIIPIFVFQLECKHMKYHSMRFCFVHCLYKIIYIYKKPALRFVNAAGNHTYDYKEIAGRGNLKTSLEAYSQDDSLLSTHW